MNELQQTFGSKKKKKTHSTTRSNSGNMVGFYHGEMIFCFTDGKGYPIHEFTLSDGPERWPRKPSGVRSSGRDLACIPAPFAGLD